ncbi:DUF305 domain-containing protein [Tessaracoccus sp. OS52]|uniref:DUF305 domain-containing protein n=1 Tax=Tessaracoccus sp. OS52 TaxID=2886691 RepID=UPI001D124602|nr:DUF305 domain-containing protein [Tessaracoccus sp. OS52]MCC2592499.1 DUF305 domain-containing protein [Tessaracoccus sp. OS52]
MSRKNQIAATLGGLLVAATLSACAAPTTTSDTATPTASSSATASESPNTTSDPTADVSTEHNQADTTFAQMMIVHHEGAIEMSELAIERAETPEVEALAERIATAQGPEIEQMSAWLTAWGEETTPSGHGGMDMGGMDMNGMSQEEMMGELESLSGAEFDKAFLEGMLAHHLGAVEMAEKELADGQNPEALALAEKIIADQQAEITEMEELLAGL